MREYPKRLKEMSDTELDAEAADAVRGYVFGGANDPLRRQRYYDVWGEYVDRGRKADVVAMFDAAKAERTRERNEDQMRLRQAREGA